ncbi:MAG: metal ABC transporter substrate-binding protein [Nitrospiraceae bacterium]
MFRTGLFSYILWAACTMVLIQAFPPQPASASTPLNVVVTLPVLKDWVQQVGGPNVQVLSLMTGYENEHTYAPKPSDLVAVRKARLLFEVGAGLEVWVASLVKNAGNAGLKVVTTSRGIELIPDHQDAHEDGHHGHGGSGNPHMWLDPESATAMVRSIAEALIAADPDHSSEYRTRTDSYLRDLKQVQQETMERMRRVPHRRIIVHHPAWPYFAKRYDIQVAGTILIQPGRTIPAPPFLIDRDDEARPCDGGGVGIPAEPEGSPTPGAGNRRPRRDSHHPSWRATRDRDVSRHASL